MPRCFRELRDPSRPANVHYFFNPKSWMTPDVMLAVLKRFNRKLLFEQRKVILFLLFKSSRSSTGKGWLSMWLEESCMENSSATQIIKDVNILIAIQWVQEAWKEVKGTTIQNCFENCGMVKKNDNLTEVKEGDLESEALVRELSPDMSAAECVYFDTDIPTSEPMINEHEFDWQERLQEDGNAINAITTQSNVNEETQEISDDNDPEDEDDIQEEGASFAESLAMLDKIKKCFFLDDESQMMLSTLTRKFEIFKLKIKENKSRQKQTSVNYACKLRSLYLS